MAGQAYCRLCRAAIQREYRAALVAELRNLTNAQLRAVLRQVRKGRARGR